MPYSEKGGAPLKPPILVMTLVNLDFCNRLMRSIGWVAESMSKAKIVDDLDKLDFLDMLDDRGKLGSF